MNDKRSNPSQEGHQRDASDSRIEAGSSIPNDLPDSPADASRLQPEETFIDLPDVKDIPGQEFVSTPSLDAIGDTTIASDDEEGTSVFDSDDSEDLRSGEGDTDRGERSALRQSDYMPTTDEDNLRRATMDNTDFDGEPLNEKGFGAERSGADSTGADLDNTDEDTDSSSR